MSRQGWLMVGCGVVMAALLVMQARAEEGAGPAVGGLRVAGELHLGGQGGWDYITCDPATHRLFIPRQSHTMVVDADSGKVLTDIADTPACHGVALAADAGRGFISDGQGVTVFDLSSLKVLGTIAAGKGSDAVIYDPASRNVVVMNGRSHDVSLIPAGAALDAAKAVNVPLGGKPEAAAADGKGRVYIDIENTSELVVLDTAEAKIGARWKLDKGEEPSGLALDVAHGLLFVGCHNKLMCIVEAKTGQTVATVPIGSGVDGCAFDPGTGEALASCGDGTLTVVKESPDIPGSFTATLVQTRPSARTIAVDPSTHTVYLPFAQMESPADGGTGRRKMKEGTFAVLVVK